MLELVQTETQKLSAGEKSTRKDKKELSKRAENGKATLCCFAGTVSRKD